VLAGAASAPSPLLANGHPVDWWFVFKFNSQSFPGCGGAAQRACLFGGTVQQYNHFGQQFVFASSEDGALQQGGGCLGDTTADPLGATFNQVYKHKLFYVIWNKDQRRIATDPFLFGIAKQMFYTFVPRHNAAIQANEENRIIFQLPDLHAIELLRVVRMGVPVHFTHSMTLKSSISARNPTAREPTRL
jgi:hypothetical protein